MLDEDQAVFHMDTNTEKVVEGSLIFRRAELLQTACRSRQPNFGGRFLVVHGARGCSLVCTSKDWY